MKDLVEICILPASAILLITITSWQHSPDLLWVSYDDDDGYDDDDYDDDDDDDDDNDDEDDDDDDEDGVGAFSSCHSRTVDTNLSRFNHTQY